MNIQLFEQSCSGLRRFPKLKPSLVDTFIQIVKKLSDREVTRINPLLFAQRNRFSEKDSIELFLHASKAGIFRMDYNQICPGCGGLDHAHDLSHIAPETIHCTSCDIDFKTTLDDQVEVSFTLNETAGRIPWDPLEDVMLYYEANRTTNWELPKELLPVTVDGILSFSRLIAGDTTRITFRTPDMPQIRLSSLDRHININLDIDKTSSQQTVIDLDLDQNGFSALPVRIPAGTVTLVIHSHLPQDAGLTVLGINRPLFYELMEKFPMIKHPYFTAKKLLNHQSFRDLFRIQELNPSLRLNLNSLTLVFTDLKGSTDMYSRVGDTSAYDAVRDHFSILFDVVRKHNGAVVKTMGDAIMATFNTPAEGFRCAVDMVSAVKEWNDTRQGQETLGLKVGVHEGSSIAVNNDDRVDFFGQTVNIAARVQGLAEAGEVWYTESIAKESGVQDLLHLHQMKPEKQEAHLKGVSGAMTVYKLVA